MLLKIYPENPNERHIRIVVECLMDGGIVIYPTDTVYGLGCDIFKSKAIERIALIKGIKAEKANFSFICNDLSQLSDYSKPIPNNIFKMMKSNLPGPFTFILNASNNVPKLIQSKKKTVGIRIPNNNIPLEIVKELGNPIMSTSIHDEDEIIEYTTDPELIYEKYNKLVDIVIDGGYGDNEPSTVIDCTSEEPHLIREGKGIMIL
ncbi:MAG TPA: L-threonylcarbamoyladenylate synthase [Lentimicrobium sp.]|nr:L-threonylcarbamoyladenylate synthase [Lentimicrobium sp.]